MAIHSQSSANSGSVGSPHRKQTITKATSQITDPIARRQLRELEAALSRLLHEQRQVILLIGLEGMNYAEAAKILNIPIGTVRSRLSRARENLRQMMDINEKKRSGETSRAAAPSLAAA